MEHPELAIPLEKHVDSRCTVRVHAHCSGNCVVATGTPPSRQGRRSPSSDDTIATAMGVNTYSATAVNVFLKRNGKFGVLHILSTTRSRSWRSISILFRYLIYLSFSWPA